MLRTQPSWGTGIYDLMAAGYDQSIEENQFYSFLRQAEVSAIGRVFPVVEDSNALDVGCGTGELVAVLARAGLHVDAFDNSIAMVEQAAQRTLALADRTCIQHLDCLDFEAWPRGPYQLVTALGSIVNHLQSEDDWIEFFQNVSRRLTPDGSFIFSFDNIAGLDSLAWLLFNLRPSAARQAAWNEFLLGLQSAARGSICISTWPMKVGDEFEPIWLSYVPTRKVASHLTSAGLKIVDIRGSNIFTTLVPRVLRAATYDAQSFSNVAQLLGWVDEKLARIGHRIASNIVVTCRPA